MVCKRTKPNSNPLLLVAIRREDYRPRLCRALERIWENPEFLIESSVRDAFDFLIEERLKSNRIKPDIFIIDLEDGGCDTGALLETARLAPGLRYAPFIALVDGEDAGLRRPNLRCRRRPGRPVVASGSTHRRHRRAGGRQMAQHRT